MSMNVNGSTQQAGTYEGVVKQKEYIMQASKSIGAGYGYRLSEEAGKLCIWGL